MSSEVTELLVVTGDYLQQAYTDKLNGVWDGSTVSKNTTAVLTKKYEEIISTVWHKGFVTGVVSTAGAAVIVALLVRMVQL